MNRKLDFADYFVLSLLAIIGILVVLFVTN